MQKIWYLPQNKGDVGWGVEGREGGKIQTEILTFRFHSYLRYFSNVVLHEILSPYNHTKWVHHPLLNFSV